MDWLINAGVNLFWYPWIHPGHLVVIAIVLVFNGMSARDLFQASIVIKRKSLPAGLGRNFIASGGPSLHQHLFENDRDERPIPRFIHGCF